MARIARGSVTITDIKDGVSNILLDWTGTQSWPTNTDINGAYEYTFNSDFSGIAQINFTAQDAEGTTGDGVRFSLNNGDEVPFYRTGPNNSTEDYTFTVSGIVRGENTLSFWSTDGDAGNIQKLKVALSAVEGARTVQGTLYYEDTTGSAPSAPSENTYEFATGLIQSLSTGTDTWTNEPRPQDPTSDNTHYILKYYATESVATGLDTLAVNYGNVTQYTNFTGVVSFTDLSTQGSTTIHGGNIQTGTIDADRIDVENLAAISANIGDITAGSIDASSVAIENLQVGQLPSSVAFDADVDKARDIALDNASNENLVRVGTFTSDNYKGSWEGTIVNLANEPGAPTLDRYSHALKLSARDNYEDRHIPVTPGETIYFSGWFNTENTTQQVRFGYRRVNNGVIENTWRTVPMLDGGNGWTWNYGSLVIPDENTTAIIPFLQIAAFEDFGSTYVNELRISRTAPVSPKNLEDLDTEANTKLVGIESGATKTGGEWFRIGNLSTTEWPEATDSTFNTVFETRTGRAPRYGDVVLAVRDTGESKTFQYNGAWNEPAAVIRGDMLVKGTVTADRIDVIGSEATIKLDGNETTPLVIENITDGTYFKVATDGRIQASAGIFADGGVGFSKIRTADFEQYITERLGEVGTFTAGIDTGNITDTVDLTVTTDTVCATTQLVTDVTHNIEFRLEDSWAHSLVDITETVANGGPTGDLTIQYVLEGSADNVSWTSIDSGSVLADSVIIEGTSTNGGSTSQTEAYSAGNYEWIVDWTEEDAFGGGGYIVTLFLKWNGTTVYQTGGFTSGTYQSSPLYNLTEVTVGEVTYQRGVFDSQTGDSIAGSRQYGITRIGQSEITNGLETYTLSLIRSLSLASGSNYGYYRAKLTGFDNTDTFTGTTPTGGGSGAIAFDGQPSLRIYSPGSSSIFSAGDISVTTNTASGGGSLTYDDNGGFTFTPASLPSLAGYATESYVDTAVSDLVDSSPDALNTLNELANALGDDPNFATTVTNSIGSKASKSGDTFTGTITQSYDSTVWSHSEATHRPLSKKIYSETGITDATTGTNITDVYGESDLSAIDNHVTFTYADAWDAVESHGGRLPTLAEVMDGVGQGSGQSYDDKYIWTCTPAGAHHVWVVRGYYASYPQKKIVDITDPSEVYRTRCFFDVSRDGRQVHYSHDGKLYVQDKEVTSTKISNWNTAYEWGDHSTENYAVTTGDTFTGELILNGSSNALTFGENPQGASYTPQENGVGNTRYFLRFNYTNNDSFPYLCNRTPSGRVGLYSGGTYAGSDIERIRILGGDGVQQVQFHNSSIAIGSNTVIDSARNLTNVGTISSTGNATIDGNLTLSGYRTFTANQGTFSYVNGGKFTIDNDTVGKLTLGSVANEAGNDYIRESIIFSRDANQITYDTATDQWTHAGGGSTDWSMITHDSEGMNFYSGAALGNAASYTHTEFETAYRAFQILTDQTVVFDNAPKVGSNEIWDKGDFSNTDVSNWNTAYGWGDHADAGYLTSIGAIAGIQDGVETAAYGEIQYRITGNNDVQQQNSIYAYGNKDVSWDWKFKNLSDSTPVTRDLMTLTMVDSDTANLNVTGTITASGYNNSNWDTAYEWGDHDGLYAQGATPATEITNLDNASLKTGMYDVATSAISHPDSGSSYTLTHIVGGASGSASQFAIKSNNNTDEEVYIRHRQANGTWNNWVEVWHSGKFSNNSSNWDTAYGWGDHANAGYYTQGSGFLTLANRELSDGPSSPFSIWLDANDVDAPASIGNYISPHPMGIYVNGDGGVGGGTLGSGTVQVYHTGHFSGTHISNWQTAYGWGDHSTQGYLTSVSWSEVSGKPSTFPPSSHEHPYLPLTGGTLTGNLTVDSNTNQTFKVSSNNTNSDADFISALIELNCSGSQNNTTDRSNIGLKVDMDSTATGGDTINEHRLIGVHSDVRATGDSDLINGGYFYARFDGSSGAPSGVYGVRGTSFDNGTGTSNVGNVYGGYFLGYASNTGTVSTPNTYGSWSQAFISSDVTGTIPNVTGSHNEVEFITGGNGYTVENIFGVNSTIDNNSGSNVTLEDSYLFYGNYTGTLPSNPYGIYISDNVPNRFGGYVRADQGFYVGITNVIDNGRNISNVPTATITTANTTTTNTSTANIGTANVSEYIRIDRSNNELGLVFEDSRGSDTIYHTVNDTQGNYNIMLGVNGNGQSPSGGDGQAKLLMTGHGTVGSVSLNAGLKLTNTGDTANYNIGFLVNASDQTLRIGNPNDNVGLVSDSGTKFLDVSRNAFFNSLSVGNSTIVDSARNLKNINSITMSGHFYFDPNGYSIQFNSDGDRDTLTFYRDGVLDWLLKHTLNGDLSFTPATGKSLVFNDASADTSEWASGDQAFVTSGYIRCKAIVNHGEDGTGPAGIIFGTADGLSGTYASDNITLATGGATGLHINSSQNVNIPNNLDVGTLRVDSTRNEYPVEVRTANYRHGLHIYQEGNTGYAPASILLQATQSASRGQGIFHYNIQNDKMWFAGTAYNDSSNHYGIHYKTGTDPDTLDSTASTNVRVWSVNGSGTTNQSGNLAINGTTVISSDRDISGVGSISASGNIITDGVMYPSSVGGSAVAGGIFLAPQYSGTNPLTSDHIAVLSTSFSSGALILGYGAAGKSGSGGNTFTSTYDNFSGNRSAIKLLSDEVQFWGTTTATQTAVGDDLVMQNGININLSTGTTNIEYGTLDIGGTTLIDNNRNLLDVGGITQDGASGSFALNVYHATTNVVARFESGNSDVWIDLHDSNSGTYGCLVGHNSTKLFRIADASVTDRLIVDNSGNLNLPTGGYQINGQTVIDSGSNLTNIGTISSGAITTSSNVFVANGSGLVSSLGAEVKTGAGGGTFHIRPAGGAYSALIVENYNGTTNSLEVNADGNTVVHNNLKVTGKTELSKPLFTDSISYLNNFSDEPKFEQANTATSGYYCASSGGCLVGVVESKTKIYSKDPLTGVESFIGEFSPSGVNTLTAVAGKIYFTKGNKPFALIKSGDNKAFLPLSASGRYFGFYSSRYQPHDVRFYALDGSIEVDLYNDKGIDGTPTSTVTVKSGEIGGFTITDEGWCYFEVRGGFAVAYKTSELGDTDLLYPASRIRVQPDNSFGGFYKKIFSNSFATTSNTVYYNLDEPVVGAAIGDGAGGDTQTGRPVQMLCDNYIIPHNLDGIAFTAVYPNTDINVYYHDGANWIKKDSYSLNGTLLSPAVSSVGALDGGGTAYINSGNRTVWVSSNQPIAVKVNDNDDDEYCPVGWLSAYKNVNTDLSNDDEFGSISVNGTITTTNKLSISNASFDSHFELVRAGSTTQSLSPSGNDLLHIGGNFAPNSNGVQGLGRAGKVWSHVYSNSFQIGTTTVIDSNSNLTNIGSITSNGDLTTTDRLRVNTDYGWAEFGAQNTNWCHIQTNRPSFYFNKKLTVDEGIIQSYDEDLILRRALSSSNQMTLNTSGATFTGNVTAYSDITLKDNITEIDNALEKVNSIRGVTYDRIDQDNARHAGVIAQEVEEVLPEVVHTDNDGIKSVAYGNMVGLLIEAIKEQQTQINELQAQINTLKGEK